MPAHATAWDRARPTAIIRRNWRRRCQKLSPRPFPHAFEQKPAYQWAAIQRLCHRRVHRRNETFFRLGSTARPKHSHNPSWVAVSDGQTKDSVIAGDLHSPMRCRCRRTKPRADFARRAGRIEGGRAAVRWHESCSAADEKQGRGISDAPPWEKRMGEAQNASLDWPFPSQGPVQALKRLHRRN
ncbi:hypothetical protein K458DRAFT_404977 [Lentithecium fluviatile CBS 122367]|uniref:Uncharacterized protein n=1 Tax=Lentithecium fluviatile CBS 122367 TaxID=1168545 RepID=A0A6G1IYV6_9PLEO|nr:hypothetical protein K458DRAFT_404977 [Lentithecium fluviatile CBS 122367]